MFCLDVLIIAFYACLWNVKDNPDQAYYFDLIIHQATVNQVNSINICSVF